MQQPVRATPESREGAATAVSAGRDRSSGLLHLMVASTLVVGGLASLLTVAPEVAFASGPACATPGAQGAGGTLAGVVNTYYPATGSYATGATSLAVGTSSGNTTPIAAGDELLVIQVQGATVNTADTNNYGAGDGTGRGATAITAGTYEYVKAASAVTGGAVTIVGAGGGGLVNAYTEAGSSRVEVVRVPQYSTATLGSSLTASAWNGTTGGILAIDVSGTLALGSATVSLNGLGFRGGQQRTSAGDTGGTPGDYVTKATYAANAEKGEGYAGTPSIPTSKTVDGYTGGDYGRGAPGNAGGGGSDANPTVNDQNTGGGGGGNGGIGGMGGNSWTTDLAYGGVGGAAFAASASSVVLGGGGGAGVNNDGAKDSSGAAGGGLALVRAGSTSGTGTITANGANAPGVTKIDSGGGGGAGGSVVVTTPSGGSLTGLTVNANGGAGGVANTANMNPHGPGGGGAGGVVLTSSAPAAATATGGANGTTVDKNGNTTAYGALPGGKGLTSATASDAAIPGVYEGAACTGAISGTIFNDADASGAINGNEGALAGGGQTVTLKSSSGAVIATTTASTTGAYTFAHVPTGQALTITSTQPSNYVVSTTSPLTVTVPANTTQSNDNIGLYTPAPLTSTSNAGVAATVTPTRTTGGSMQLLNGSGTPVLSLTVAGGTYTTNGTSTTNGTTITFTPTAGFSGTAPPATYQVTNATGQTATSTYTPTITPVGVADPNYTTPFNTTLTVTTTSPQKSVLANDLATGPKGAMLVAQASHGTVTLATDGTFTYVPNSTYAGTDTFTYSATDASGQAYGPVTATITVGNPAAPTANPESFTTTAVPATATTGNSVTVPVISNSVGGTDVGTGTLTPVIVKQPANGKATVTGTGTTATITYTANPGFSGSDPFTYDDTDTYGNTSNVVTEPVTVTPTAFDDSRMVVDGSTLSATVPTPAGLPGAGGFTYTLVNGPADAPNGFTFDKTSGAYSYTPSVVFTGPDSFTYTVMGAGGTSNTATVSLTVTSPPAPTPVTDSFSTSDQLQSAGSSFGQPTTVMVTGNDMGVVGSVTAVVVAQPKNGTATVSSDGQSITYTPKAGFSGSDPFTYALKDSFGQTSASVQESVNVTPYAVNDSFSTTFPTAVTNSTSSLTANDQGSVLKVTAIDATSSDGGMIAFNQAAGTYTYTPPATYPASGVDTFNYTATDSTGQPTSAVVTVLLSKPGTPSAAPHMETTPVNMNLTVPPATNLLTGSSGTKLTVVAQPAGTPTTAGGTVTVNTDGTYTYVPKPGFSGTDTFKYTVQDPSGQTATNTVTITVTPVAKDDSRMVVDGSTLSATVPTPAGLPGAGGFTYTLVNGPADAPNGFTFDKTSGAYSYTPSVVFTGPDSFTYTVMGAGGTSNTATVSLTVTSPPAPTPVTDSFSTSDQLQSAGSSFGQPTTVMVTGNDMGVVGSVTAVVVAQPKNGTATVSSDGQSITYTPKAGFSGSDPFTYALKDSFGQTSASVQESVNVTPYAVNDSFSTTFPTAVTNSTSSLTANDQGSVLKVTAIDATSSDGGMIAFNQAAGTYTYTPPATYPASGVDTFNYTATDSTGQPTSAVVTVLLSKPGTPSAAPHMETTPVNMNLTVPPATNLLTGSSGTKLTVVAQPAGTPTTAGGTVTVNTDGTYTYVPKPGFSGTDTFGYTVQDPSAQTATNTVTITVTPKANDDTESVTYNNNTPIFSGAVPTPTGQPGAGGFTYTLVNGPKQAASNGFSFDPATGKYTYSPAAPFIGNDTFTYTVTGAGGTSPAVGTITLNVKAPAAPAAVTDALTASAKAPLAAGPSVNVVSNDMVPFGIVTANVVNQGMHGTVTPSADGQSFTYTPTNSTYSGPDSFTYDDVDTFGHAGNTVTDTVIITPYANADSIKAPFPSPATFQDTALTSNDNGGPTLTVTAADGTTADGGSVVLNSNGTFTYTPPKTYPASGSDSFNYTISDGTSTSTAKVTVDLTPTLPVAVNDNQGNPVTVKSGAAPVTFPSPGVLANDTGAGLTPTLTTQGTYGTAKVAADGSYTYTAPSTYSGPDSFTYTDTDVAGQTSKAATVFVDVLPVGNPGAVNTAYGAPVTVTPAGDDFGKGITITSAVNPTDGRGSVTQPDASGNITFTPSSGTTGPVVFTYYGKDASGQTFGPVNYTVTVGAPGQPVANNDGPTGSKPTSGTTTTAGTATVIPVLANDSGTPPLTPVIVAYSANGTPTVNPDGTVTYTPTTALFSGIDTFTYYVTDQAGQKSNTATVTVDVTPQGVADQFTTGYLMPATFNPAQNDDATNPSVTKLGTAPTKGSAVLNGNGTITYTPKTGASGTDTFTYYGQDGSNQPYGPITVTVTIGEPTAPVAANYVENTPANAALTQPKAANLLSNSTGTNITVVPGTVKTAHGSVTINSDGTYTYTPATDYSGPDTFTYTVKDEAGQTAPGTVSLTVTPTAAPDPITVANSSPGYTAATSTLLGNDHGSGLTVTAVDAKSAQGGTVTLNGTSYTYVPLPGYTGTDSFGYTDTDASPLAQQVSSVVTITVLPPRPSAGNDPYTTTAGSVLTVNAPGVLGNDSGSGILSVTAGSTSKPTAGGTLTGGAINSDGSFTYTPPSATFSGTDTFTYTTTGAGGVSDPATVTVTVDPVAKPDNKSVLAGGTLTTTTPTGVGSGQLTYTLVPGQGPTHNSGTFTLDPTTGGYSYTPVSGFTGSDAFYYTVTDKNGLVSAAVPVSIAVGTPAAPMPTDDSNTAVSGGTSAPAPSVLSNDIGDDLSVPAGNVTQPPSGQGSVVMKTDGTYTYTAPTTFSGVTSFTYTPVDATGQPSAKPATVTITVSPAAQPTSEQVAEDMQATFTVPTPSGSGPFTYTVTSGPQAGAAVTSNGNGSFTYTPKPGTVGNDSFSYTVTSGGLTSQPATVSIGVGQAPTPTAVKDLYTVTAGSTTTIDAPGVLINDLGDKPTANLPTATAQGGTITPGTGGGFTYTAPPGGFSGVDTFSYTVTDVNNVTSPAVTDTITVDPVATSDSYPVTGGATYASPTSLLDNDLGTGKQVVNVSKTTSGVTVTVNPDGTFSYTPPTGFTGDDVFTYQVEDSSGLFSKTAYVTLDVLKPAPPAGVADSLQVAAGSTNNAAPQSVLANDSGVGLTIAKYTQPTAGGTLVLNTTTGDYTYTPPTGFSGTDTFTYTPIDAYKQLGAPVTVTITVAPVAGSDSRTVQSGSVLSATVPTPTGSGPFTYTVTTQPLHGGVVLDPTTGAYSYTPDANYLGADAFAYTVSDAGGPSLPAQISIDVVNPVPPSGSGSVASGSAGTPLTGSVASHDTGFAPLTTTVDTNPAHGTLTLNPDGSYVYTPAPGFSGPDSFTYIVTDAFGTASAPITVSLTIGPLAVADANTTSEGIAVSGNVLTNDAGTGLTAVLVTSPAHGALTLNPNGTYTYTPNAGYVGTDTFSYVAKDAAGNSSPAVSVTISVGAGTPAITGGTQQTVKFGGTPAPITFTAPPGSTETVTTSKPGSLPPGITLTSTGSFIGKATKAGTYTFPVTVTDPAGGTTTRNVTIVIQAAPVVAASAVAATTTVGDVFKLPNLGGTITKVSGTLPPGIRVDGEALVGKGTKPGKYVVTVTVSVHGKTVTRKVTVTVKPKPPVQPTGHLAFTGAPVSALVEWALLLLAMGVGLVFFGMTRTRRRRRS